MHQCLSIVEIQRTIFRDVHGEPGGRPTLARLARTCRAFSNTALDVLWAEIDSFLHLVRALPRDLWNIPPAGKKMTFQRPMSLKDWEIFFGYSSRIRSLSVSEFLCRGLGDDVIFALSVPPFYGPLVPHLKILRWDGLNRRHAPLLRLLLSPSLDKISFTSCSVRSPEVSVLNSIGTICPSLKYLQIAPSDTLDTDSEKILSEVFSRLRSLETLVHTALSEVTIIPLCHLPSLVNLTLDLQPNFQAEKVQPYLAPPAFASIQSLTLYTRNLSILTTWLKPMHFKPREVSFYMDDTPTLDALNLFYLTLAGSCDPKQLSSVSLTTSDEEALGAQRLTLSTFHPLLAFPNINSFEFNVTCNIALDDDAINTLVNQWPRLTALSINATSGWGITSCITPKGLIKLLSGCTELATIALSVDFSSIDKPRVPRSRPGNGAKNDKCRLANFVTSTIEHPTTIATFLRGICPNLRWVESSWSDDLVEQEIDMDDVDTLREKWEEVQDSLPRILRRGNE